MGRGDRIPDSIHSCGDCGLLIGWVSLGLVSYNVSLLEKGRVGECEIKVTGIRCIAYAPLAS